MSVVKRIGRAAVAAAIAIVLMTPMSVEARNGRIAAGFVGGLAAGALFGAAIGGGNWGPYPYYGYPGPVYYYPPARIGGLVRFGDRMDMVAATSGLCGTGGMCTTCESVIEPARFRFQPPPAGAAGRAVVLLSLMRMHQRT